MRKNRLIEWKKSLIGQCLPSQVFPLSLLAYPKTQGHWNDPSVFLHVEFGLFPQVWLPVVHSSISERYNEVQILLIKWFKSEEPWSSWDLTCSLYSFTSSTYAIGKSWHLTLVFSPQWIVNVGWRIVGATGRNLAAINLHRNNSMLWKHHFSFVSLSVCHAIFFADQGLYRLT